MTAMFKAPKTPTLAAPAPMAEAIDEAAVRKDRQRRVVAASRAGGRESTLLSDASKLGG
jgi:hypothetical protein